MKNRDLWECLLGRIEKFDDSGMKVEFWRIPREMNFIADAAAKSAAEEVEIDGFQDVTGV